MSRSPAAGWSSKPPSSPPASPPVSPPVSLPSSRTPTPVTTLAIVVTTYNRPDALAQVLSAYLSQEDREFELLVADDGSTSETRAVIEAFAERAPFPVRHVWHEDRGFRAGAIRNRAILASAADYLVFTDGDCVPLPGFVARHRALAAPGWFVAGNRLLLSAGFTAQVLREQIPVETFSALDWAWRFLRRDVNRLAPLWLRDDGAWRLRQPDRWQGAKTCNLGVWRNHRCIHQRRGAGRECAREAAVLVDHLVNLGHQANRLAEGDHDALIVAQVFGAERAALAILQPLLAHLVAADVKRPHRLRHAAEAEGLALVQPHGAVAVTHLLHRGCGGADVVGDERIELGRFQQVQRDELAAFLG